MTKARPKTKRIGLNRLLKLATHLETGKLAHKQFRFEIYNRLTQKQANEAEQNEDKRNVCGTAGCAAGETPHLWPKLIQWDNNGITLCDDTEIDSIDAMAELFDITSFEVRHLFIPGCQNTSFYGGKGHLPPTATRRMVASNIRAFAAKKLEARCE